MSEELLAKAIAAGKQCWALVFRKGRMRQVRGEEVKPNELLAWTWEGHTEWIQAGRIVSVTKKEARERWEKEHANEREQPKTRQEQMRDL